MKVETKLPKKKIIETDEYNINIETKCDICQKHLYWDLTSYNFEKKKYKCSVCNKGDFCTEHMKAVIVNDGDSYNGIDPEIVWFCTSCQEVHKELLGEILFEEHTIETCENELLKLNKIVKKLVK